MRDLVQKNVSTAMKISIIRKLFTLFKEDPLDLVFYLRDDQKEKNAEETRFELRRRYWTFSLPIIREKTTLWGAFANRNPGTDNYLSGFVGLRGFSINCIANYDCAKVEFWLGNGDTLKNKEAFDYLFCHKNEIEQTLGIELDWNRADNKKCSSITYTIHNVSIVEEADWQRMAKFHAEWSAKFCEVMLPFLYEKYNGSSLQNVKDNQCLNNLAEIIKEWAIKKTAEGKMKVVLEKCNRTYIRFLTEEFSVILPPTPGALSGWNTPEHYFYEIINRTGDSFYIALAISSKNLPDDQRQSCDQIFKQVSLKKKKEDWQWASVIRSETMKFSKDAGKEELFKKLDEAFMEIIKKQEKILDIVKK